MENYYYRSVNCTVGSLMYINVFAPFVWTYLFNWRTSLEEGLLFLKMTKDEVIEPLNFFLVSKPLLGLSWPLWVKTYLTVSWSSHHCMWQGCSWYGLPNCSFKYWSYKGWWSGYIENRWSKWWGMELFLENWGHYWCQSPFACFWTYILVWYFQVLPRLLDMGSMSVPPS